MEVFLHKIPRRFLCKLLWLGDYRGHISLAYPGTIPGAVNTLGGGSGLPGGRSADRRGRRSRRQILHRRQAVGGGSDGGGGRRVGQTVGRAAASSCSRQDGQPSASAASRAGAGDTKRAGPRRDTMPRRCTGEAQRKPSTARAASHPPAPQASRPQEIPNARAREDTTTRRPARNSKRARARYWRRGGRPLRVRKPKIFLGRGSKNRFRGAGAGKVGGVKNATEEENGAVLGKKKPPMRRLMARKAGGCNMNGRALAYAREATGCGEVGGDEASGGGYHFRGITKMVRGRAGRRCRDGK